MVIECIHIYTYMYIVLFYRPIGYSVHKVCRAYNVLKQGVDLFWLNCNQTDAYMYVFFLYILQSFGHMLVSLSIKEQKCA